MTKPHNMWPAGKLPKDFQRKELDELREAGYDWKDPRDAIGMFERKIAKFAGSKYAILVDCCSNGLFLCMKYLKATGEIRIPAKTYVSVPMQIMHAGCTAKFEDVEWSGVYQMKPYPLYDSAVRWRKGMFVGGDDSLQVISFQIKKRIPIGRGGVILMDSKEAYDWLNLARYDGRDLSLPYNHPEHFKAIGYHMYMTPEDAARGIMLMDKVGEDIYEDTGSSKTYPDISGMKIFR